MLNDFLLVGAGYSARAFARARPERPVRISGTTRSVGKFERLTSAGIEPLLFDGETINPDLEHRLASVQALIISASPEDAGDPFLAAVDGRLGALAPALRWIGYLSTVGVYGDHQGAWIDETADLRPSSERSQRRLAAERGWLDAGAARSVPVAVLRLSGIYGPGRNGLINLRDGTARRLVKPGQVFNRIHVADIAGSLWHLLEAQTGGIFNVTDDLPAPPQDVVAYAATLMGIEPPAEIDFDTADLSTMARSFYGENKRISNAKLRACGYSFAYPDFRTALDAMWTDGSWIGEASDKRAAIRRG